MDFETKMSLVIGVVCLIIIVLCTGAADNRCIEKGGQIIRNSTKMNHGCILPAGVK